MPNKVSELLDFEFGRFRIAKMYATKEELFSTSYEIEMKKMICNVVAKMDLDEETKAKLSRTRNLLGNIYALMEEKKSYDPDYIPVCLNRIVDTL